jgi:lipid-A-disaccharide synthase
VYWERNPETLLKHSDFLFCASGTATLQAVLHRTPMIILAALPPLTYWVAKLFFSLDKKMPWVSLPNIITGKETVPEFVQQHIKADDLYAQYIKLQRPSTLSKLLKGYDTIAHSLEGKGFMLKGLSRFIFRL